MSSEHKVIADQLMKDADQLREDARKFGNAPEEGRILFLNAIAQTHATLALVEETARVADALTEMQDRAYRMRRMGPL